jgi:hypothetical protein
MTPTASQGLGSLQHKQGPSYYRHVTDTDAHQTPDDVAFMVDA